MDKPPRERLSIHVPTLVGGKNHGRQINNVVGQTVLHVPVYNEDDLLVDYIYRSLQQETYRLETITAGELDYKVWVHEDLKGAEFMKVILDAFIENPGGA